MVLFDFIVLGLALVAIIIGVFAGFHRGMKFIFSGVSGFIVSLLVCYFVFGLVLNIGFVANFCTSLSQSLADNGSGFCNFLLTIRIDLIIVALVVIAIVQLLRIVFVVLIVKAFCEEVYNVSVLSRICGAFLFLVFFAVLILIVFGVLAIFNPIGDFLYGSFLKLDVIYEWNPLVAIIDQVTRTFA